MTNARSARKHFKSNTVKILGEDLEAKNNHVKDFKVVTIIDNYENEIQMIIIQRIEKSNFKNNEKVNCRAYSRSRSSSRSRSNSRSRYNSRFHSRSRSNSRLSSKQLAIKTDSCDVTLACDGKQVLTHEKVRNEVGDVLLACEDKKVKLKNELFLVIIL